MARPRTFRRYFAYTVAVATTISLGIVALTTAASSLEEESSPRSVVDQLVDAAASVTDEEQARVLSYWTPERMRNAINADQLADRATQKRDTEALTTGEPLVINPTLPQTETRAAPGDAAQGEWGTSGLIATTSGKVFMTFNGRDYICSGTVVSAGNHDTVLTAGHCLFDYGNYASNFIFVPAYSNNERPLGTWTARRLVSTNEWAQSGNLNFDVGFAILNSLDGNHVQDRAGSQGIAFNQARGQHVFSFGYPSNQSVNGERLYYCQGVVTDDSYGGSNDQTLQCGMGEGSSGGGWLTNFDTAQGVGTLYSLNSYGYSNMPDIMYGPYFGNVIRDTYQRAQGI